MQISAKFRDSATNFEATNLFVHLYHERNTQEDCKGTETTVCTCMYRYIYIHTYTYPRKFLPSWKRNKSARSGREKNGKKCEKCGAAFFEPRRLLSRPYSHEPCPIRLNSFKLLKIQDFVLRLDYAPLYISSPLFGHVLSRAVATCKKRSLRKRGQKCNFTHTHVRENRKSSTNGCTQSRCLTMTSIVKH